MDPFVSHYIIPKSDSISHWVLGICLTFQLTLCQNSSLILAGHTLKASLRVGRWGMEVPLKGKTFWGGGKGNYVQSHLKLWNPTYVKPVWNNDGLLWFIISKGWGGDDKVGEMWCPFHSPQVLPAPPFSGLGNGRQRWNGKGLGTPKTTRERPVTWIIVCKPMSATTVFTQIYDIKNVGKTISCLPSPSQTGILIWGGM